MRGRPTCPATDQIRSNLTNYVSGPGVVQALPGIAASLGFEEIEAEVAVIPKGPDVMPAIAR
jgi:hypothetical protein